MTSSKIYRVTGMTCGGCANAVKNAIQAQHPTATVTVDLATQRITVTGWDDDSAIAQAVSQAGFHYEGVVSG